MKCTVCSEEMGNDTLIMCRSCERSYDRNKIAENAMWLVIEWSANRARHAEHKRMSTLVKVLEEKLRIEIATTDGLIRKYGNTTTEIGDMNERIVQNNSGHMD